MHNYDLWEKESLKDEEHPLVPYNVTEPFRLYRFPDEEVTIKGRLIGGCMDCLVNLLGTSFDEVRAFNERYEEDGIIWFLESCDLNIMSIMGLLAEYEVPVIMDLDIGHLAPMMPMISGALAKVHSVGNSIDIRYIFE